MSSIKHYKQKGAVARPLFIVIITLAITALLIWLLLTTKPQPQANLQSASPVVVELYEVEKRSIQPFEEVTGRLHPGKTAQIHFEVAGQVKQRLVKPGSSVKAQQVLIELYDDDYRDELKQKESELAIETRSASRDQSLLSHARSNLALQQQEEQRLQQLVGRNLIAQSQLDGVRQQVFELQSEVTRLEFLVETANARINMKKAQRNMARRNLDRCKLEAPFAGIVNEIMIDEGDFVEVNQVSLSLVDISVHELKLDVRGELVAALQLGQEIPVKFQGMWLNGNVVALQTDPNADTNTHQVRVRLSHADLQAGMLASAKIPLIKKENALLVPVSSVATLQASYYVYVFADGVIHKTPVTIGKRVGDEYIILSGISAGQKIVARDVISLLDRQSVIVE
jgi:RND family efflux transporter MFP subunit